MSSFNVRDFLERLGLDIRTVFSGLIVIVCALWTLSAQYENAQNHFAVLDRNQSGIEQSLIEHDATWRKALADNSQQLADHLKQLQDQNLKAQEELSNRVTVLENWRADEQKRDEQEEMTIARIGEQITSMNSSVADVKTMLQGIMIDKYESKTRSDK